MEELNQNQPSQQAPVVAPAAPSAKSAADSLIPGVDAARFYAALSYVGPLFLLPALLVKDNAFVKFHVRQGLLLFVVEFLASFLAYVPLVGWIISVLLLALALFGFVRALQGAKWEMPLLGAWAKELQI